MDWNLWVKDAPLLVLLALVLFDLGKSLRGIDRKLAVLVDRNKRKDGDDDDRK